MELSDYHSSLSFGIGVALGAIPMVTPRRWIRYIGWPLASIAIFFIGIGIRGWLRRPALAVTLSESQRQMLGLPEPAEPITDKEVYQGLYEKGFVIWISARFFVLGSDNTYWHSFRDYYPTNDPQWFTRSSLRSRFQQCGDDRLPIGGLAKAMSGPQKQYYAWLGCLKSPNSASITSEGVVVQKFQNGYVIEGVLDPPQSAYRQRIVLLNDSGWTSELIDKGGQYSVPAPH